nr:hypothetical protein C17D12.4 - Caenorhabditis elegans [Caenorhabditis elegans]
MEYARRREISAWCRGGGKRANLVQNGLHKWGEREGISVTRFVEGNGKTQPTCPTKSLIASGSFTGNPFESVDEVLLARISCCCCPISAADGAGASATVGGMVTSCKFVNNQQFTYVRWIIWKQEQKLETKIEKSFTKTKLTDKMFIK